MLAEFKLVYEREFGLCLTDGVGVVRDSLGSEFRSGGFGSYCFGSGCCRWCSCVVVVVDVFVVLA